MLSFDTFFFLVKVFEFVFFPIKYDVFLFIFIIICMALHGMGQGF